MILFLTSIYQKAANFPSFIVILLSTDLFKIGYVEYIAWSVIIIECITAFFLFQRGLIGLSLTAFLLVLYLIYITVLRLYYYYPECGCGGILAQLSFKYHFIANMSLLTVALVTVYLQIKNKKMKASKIILVVILAFFMNSFTEAKAQLKVVFEGTLLSASMTNRLENEVRDPLYLQAYKDLIGQYQATYGLYIDSENQRSVFIEENEYGLDGPPPFKSLDAFYQTGSQLYFEDLFRGKKFQVKDDPSNLKWDIKKETIQIGQFSCRKAVLRDDPFHTVAWFSEDYPLPYGPSLGVGLPGLVVLLENDYFSLKVKEILKKPMPDKIKNIIDQMAENKGQTLKEYHNSATPMLKKMHEESILN